MNLFPVFCFFFLLSEQKRKSNIRIIFIQWGIILSWNSNLFKKKIPKNNFEGKYWINMEELKGFKRWNAVRWPIETLNRGTTWPLWPLGGRSQFHHSSINSARRMFIFLIHLLFRKCYFNYILLYYFETKYPSGRTPNHVTITCSRFVRLANI